MLNHDHIGTEHILLGLIREGEGGAAQVLIKLAVEQRVGIGPDSSGVDRQIAQVRRDKESAIDAPGVRAPGRRTAGRRTVARRRGRGLGTRLHLVPFHRWDILRHITT